TVAGGRAGGRARPLHALARVPRRLGGSAGGRDAQPAGARRRRLPRGLARGPGSGRVPPRWQPGRGRQRRRSARGTAGAGVRGELDGRSALITGGTQGLGLEIARAYLRAGAAGVCICGRDATALADAERELRGLATDRQEVLALAADVSDAEDV